MKKHIYLCLMALFFLFFALSGSQKQQRFPAEEHEVEVRLVLVDVIVTKDGEFVTDLKMEEMELYEDGKRVPINSFELISFSLKRAV